MSIPVKVWIAVCAVAAMLVPLLVSIPIISTASSASAAAIMCLSPEMADGTAHAGDSGAAGEIPTRYTTTPLGAQLAALPVARNPETKLQPNTILVLRTIETLWPYYKTGGNIYGWRQDPIADHPSGQALDVMLKDGGRTAASVSAATEIANFLTRNHRPLGVDYMMFRHRIWEPGSGWRQAKEYGSWTSNHMDHIHLKVYGSHVPTGTLKLPAGKTLPTVRQATGNAPASGTSAGTQPRVAATTDKRVWPVGRGQMGGLHPTGARDMGRAMGHPVVAAHDGKVTESKDITNGSGGYSSYGRMVVVSWKTRSGGWLNNLYAHMRDRKVTVGQEVKAGQLIGYVGSTGNSTGPHLHFELYSGGPGLSGYRTGIDSGAWLEGAAEPDVDALPSGDDVTAAECEAAGGTIEELPTFGGSGPYKDNPAPAKTVGTTRSGIQAAKWLMTKVGVAGYVNQCLGLADDAYGATSRLPRAIDQWYRAKRAGYANPGDRNPPIGAQLFWWTPNDARHIATYVGGGKVVTNVSADGNVQLLPASELDSWGPYIGWAHPYYGR